MAPGLWYCPGDDSVDLNNILDILGCHDNGIFLGQYVDEASGTIRYVWLSKHFSPSLNTAMLQIMFQK